MKDFTEFAVGPLRLPYKGKLYEIPPVDIATGLLLRKAVTDRDAQALEELAGTDEEAGYRRILGSAYAQMKADGVPWEFMDRAYLTAVTDHQRGRIIAETVWELGHDPKAITGLMLVAARIATSGADAASTPKSPNSGSSTSINPDAKTS